MMHGGEKKIEVIVGIRLLILLGYSYKQIT
jgi:hypothetical protein